MKLSKIQDFIKQVHQVLASTYKSEELEMILRDLDEIAQNSGLELSKSEPIGKLKHKISHEDRISAKMHKTQAELNSIKNLEEERQFKNLIEKLSIAELSQRLQDLLKDIEEVTAYEKKMLTNQIDQYRETMEEKEKRMNDEVKTLKKERKDILVRLSTLDLEDETDKKKLKSVLDSLQKELIINQIQSRKEQDDKISSLDSENKKLYSYATQVTKILDENNTKVPVRLQDQGRYKALQSANKNKTRKSQYLNTSNRSDISINSSVRKSQKKGKVQHSQGWR